MNLLEHQRKLLTTVDERLHLLVGDRRVGKTIGSIGWAAAQMKVGHDVLWLASSRTGVINALREAWMLLSTESVKIVRGRDLVEAVVDGQVRRIYFRNGHEAYSLTEMRGRRISKIVIDECFLLSNADLNAIWEFCSTSADTPSLGILAVGTMRNHELLAAGEKPPAKPRYLYANALERLYMFNQPPLHRAYSMRLLDRWIGIFGHRYGVADGFRLTTWNGKMHNMPPIFRLYDKSKVVGNA